MADPRRNAAISYTNDGYDPVSRGINGRRMAGQSFLKGFFRHAEVDEFVAMTKTNASGKEFGALAHKLGATRPVRNVLCHSPAGIAPCGTLFFYAPNYEEELWRRHAVGAARYSVCGINHTISTAATMAAIFAGRAGPQYAWDGMICTSRSSKAALDRQMDAIDDLFRTRVGAAPPRPQMPVIPLGSNTADYARDDDARAALRQTLGYGAEDVVVTVVSRLEPYGKFDPLPLYIAMQAAQAELGEGTTLRFLACGHYKDDHSRLVFEEGARRLMPGVRFDLHDGTLPQGPRGALSAADIFVFPIDNFQETFGLAPIEAMAAGLPVIVSDWDGMRDTVTADVGLRIRTRMLGPRHSVSEAWQYFTHPNQSGEYGSRTSAMIEIDGRALKDALVALAGNGDLRAAMGAAGLARARGLYDWSVVVPQYQDVWAELDAIRRREGSSVPAPAPGRLEMNPIALPPTWQFESYASEILRGGIGPCVARPHTVPVAEMFALRRYDKLGASAFERSRNVAIVYDSIRAAGAAGLASEDLARALDAPRIKIDRILIWLMKYGYIALKDGLAESAGGGAMDGS